MQSEISHMQRLYENYGGTLGLWLDIEDEAPYKQANGWYDHKNRELLNKGTKMWLQAFPKGGIYCDRSHKGYLNIPSEKWWAATLDGTKLDDCVLCQYSEDPIDTNIRGRYYDSFVGKTQTESGNINNAVSQLNSSATVDYTVKVISANGVNIRSGAGTVYGILGAVPKGVQLRVARQTSGGMYNWGLVVYGGIQGWIALTEINFEK